MPRYPASRKWPLLADARTGAGSRGEAARSCKSVGSRRAGAARPRPLPSARGAGRSRGRSGGTLALARFRFPPAAAARARGLTVRTWAGSDARNSSQRGPMPLEHRTVSTYSIYGCRCGACRAANREANRGRPSRASQRAAVSVTPPRHELPGAATDPFRSTNVPSRHRLTRRGLRDPTCGALRVAAATRADGTDQKRDAGQAHRQADREHDASSSTTTRPERHGTDAAPRLDRAPVGWVRLARWRSSRSEPRRKSIVRRCSPSASEIRTPLHARPPGGLQASRGRVLFTDWSSVAADLLGLEAALEGDGTTYKTHDLRHYAASALIAGGASVKQVQMILGHASAASPSASTRRSEPTTPWTPTTC